MNDYGKYCRASLDRGTDTRQARELTGGGADDMSRPGMIGALGCLLVAVILVAQSSFDQTGATGGTDRNCR